ncbi:hypothetical protein A6395_15370 [Exiguobacterium sp. SH31]|uniref:hypothetical protein n=1 Tax=Exiguobacterium sp. SH31 TaxID=1843183 RepID=UPI0008C33404|nr:hypothetical protein [Exiguobacterium sp. SH31]OGX77788.1 hypothetical protein A6395_15370 [Exiguobacterium sp. SH31]
MTDNELLDFKKNFEGIFSYEKVEYLTEKKDYSYSNDPNDRFRSDSFEYVVEFQTYLDVFERRIITEATRVTGELVNKLEFSKWFDLGSKFVPQIVEYDPETVVIDIGLEELDTDRWIEQYRQLMNDVLYSFSLPLSLENKNGKFEEVTFKIAEASKIR